MSYIAIGLSLLALLIVACGFRFAERSKRPRSARLGAVIIGAGLILFWLLPVWLFSADRGVWAMPMFVGILFIAGSVLALGLQLTARAWGAPEQTRNDALFEDFIRHNDLP